MSWREIYDAWLLLSRLVAELWLVVCLLALVWARATGHEISIKLVPR